MKKKNSLLNDNINDIPNIENVESALKFLYSCQMLNENPYLQYIFNWKLSKKVSILMYSFIIFTLPGASILVFIYEKDHCVKKYIH